MFATQTSTRRGPRRERRGGMLVAVAGAGALALAIVGAGIASGRASALRAGPAGRVAVATAAPAALATAGRTTTETSANAAGAAAAAPSASPAATRHGPILLWPFTSAAQVHAWERAYRDGGHQPWHADPCQTGSLFVQHVLGFSDVTEVASCRTHGRDAQVVPGYPGQGRIDASGATVHLVRVGRHPGAWVVVGTLDRPTLTLTSPRYGARVGRQVHLAGQVGGLGEDVLTVRLLDPSGRRLGQPWSRLISLGGPWSVEILRPGTDQPVLIAVASTDSGLGSLGDLAITVLKPR